MIDEHDAERRRHMGEAYPAHAGYDRPGVLEATIAIVTRNRREELRSALASATTQRGRLELLVLDDASDDATAAAVASEFPRVRVVRFDQRAGLVVRRNDAARMARAPVIVSIDDDAVFSSPDCVVQALRDFDHPAVAAVAIPYDEIDGQGARLRQVAPDRTGIWVAPTFRGTAYAVRRDVFLALGGFREQIVHQGEEGDFCLRLLAAGYVVRLGRGDPVHHRPSPNRDLDRMDIYGRRNEMLTSFTHFPIPLALGLMIVYAIRGLAEGARRGRSPSMVRGIWSGMRVCWELRHERRPVSWRIALLNFRIRRAKAVQLESVTSHLPAAPRPERAAGSGAG
jgi:glycosyltransferase involved in cell wall biosynthesis